jgi:diaminopimelate epimerase
MRIPFTKMHGLGNDFMMLDLVTNEITLEPGQINQLANRRTGVGFDQLLQIRPPSEPGVDFDYRIFNANGTEVEHCGNGARCFAQYVLEKGLTEKNSIAVKTVNRTLNLTREADGQFTVDMDVPAFLPAAIPFFNDEQNSIYSRIIQINEEESEIKFCALSMGNPHAVIIVENLAATDVSGIGKALGKHPDFPEGVNVGFMQIIDREHVKLRVFERGAGETLACGTGACAAVAAGCLRGLLDDTVTADLLGGKLTICWKQNGSSVFMSGPANTVYEGTIQI